MIAKVLIFFVRVYQVVFSPLVGRCCRFYPSCSVYSITALERHGSLRGAVLSIWRILRCNPFNPGGVDFVPDAREDASGVDHGMAVWPESGGRSLS